MSKVRAVVYGVGEMGSLAARMLVEKDVEIVGAIARSDEKVGKDLSEVAGLDRPIGVTVQRDADAVLNEANADIAIVAVTSLLADHVPHLEACARAGTNAITLSEEAFYPWNSSPDLTNRLDELAKANGVTITGGGAQDVFWVQLISTLMGAAHQIENVRGYTTWNVDNFGPKVLEDMRIGATPEDVAPVSSEATEEPLSFGRMVVEALVASAGLSPLETTTQARPEVADDATPSKGLGTTIEAGRVIGLTSVDRVLTTEGVEVALEITGRIYGPGETDVNEWTITGEPMLHLRNADWDVRTVTCTGLVNRIPDVINAEPGFVTVDRLPAPRYRALPLSEYVR